LLKDGADGNGSQPEESDETTVENVNVLEQLLGGGDEPAS
jgi:hypothetical protein